MIDVTGYGGRIKQAVLEWSARKGERLTLQDVGKGVAALIGRKKPFTASTVQGWTNEESEPTLSIFLALAQLSGRSAAWIAFGESPKIVTKPSETPIHTRVPIEHFGPKYEPERQAPRKRRPKAG